MTEALRDRHPELRQLFLEHRNVRAHNLGFRDGDQQDGLLLFAEAALVCLVLERFLRVILAPDVSDNDTLYNLLQRAVAKRQLRLPWSDSNEGTQRIKTVRNTMLHGNFEQAAAECGCTVSEYFRNQFAAETEQLFELLEHVVKQFDPVTGRTRQGQ